MAERVRQRLKTKTMTDDQILERPSDCERSDDDDDDQEEEEEEESDPMNMKPDRFSSTNNLPFQSLTRQRTLYENDWPRRPFIDIHSDQTLYFNSPHYRSFSNDENPSTMNKSKNEKPSKIPKLLSSSSSSQGAFRFFTADDRAIQPSPFTPIGDRSSVQRSAGHTPLIKVNYSVDRTSDDDEEEEVQNLKEEELKLKLKEQKRFGKETGELLIQLHENYNQLLEKYAQAENTIDQLRFQPKILGETTPPSAQAIEGTIHFVHQAPATVRSSGLLHSTTVTPMSSSFPQPFSSTTTTTTRKSSSPANSGTIESVFFDEPSPQKITVQELTTPEQVKLDLLLQTKSLSEKMKSFLTLMDANQLSLAEQRQVYESIKEDYEKLLQAFDQKKLNNERTDIDLDADLNDELENMKQLLKEIVKRLTDNLLGNSGQSSDAEPPPGKLRRDGSHSSQISVHSSLCNHADLMDQYKKLLNAMNHELDQNRSISPEPARVTTATYSLNQSVEDDPIHPSTLQKTNLSRNQINFQQYDNLQNHLKTPRKIRVEQRKPIYDQYEEETPPPVGPIRLSASSMRTRNSDYDSGFGTHNTTKLSRDSKLNASTIDETHSQTLDELHQHHSDEELMTSRSSSRSSASGAAASSPRSLSNKYTRRFNSSSSLKPGHRRKPSGHSDGYPSDLETCVTGSFDPIPRAQPVQTRKSRPFHRPAIHRSATIASGEHFDHILPYRRPSTKDPSIISKVNRSREEMGRHYQTGFVHPNRSSQRMYHSSVYIDHQAHPERKRSNEDLHHYHRRSSQGEKPIVSPHPDQQLYLDPNTGTIYRYQTETTPRYRCDQCGSVTNFYHRHHLPSTPPSRTPDLDDPGYESGQKRRRSKQRAKLSPSDTETDEPSSSLDLSMLNEVYERAKKVQHRSQNLSRHVNRQLKLLLATM